MCIKKVYIRTILYIAFFAIVFFLLSISIFYAYLYFYMISENQKSHENFYVKKSFHGRISNIFRYESPYTIHLEIETDEGEKLGYGAICVDDEFVNFVSEGNKINKNKSTNYVTIYDKNGKKKNFELKFCDSTK